MGKRVKAARAQMMSDLQAAQAAASAPGATQADKDRAAQLETQMEAENVAHRQAAKRKGLAATLAEINRSPLNPAGATRYSVESMYKMYRPGDVMSIKRMRDLIRQHHVVETDPSGRKLKQYQILQKNMQSSDPAVREAARQQELVQTKKGLARGRTGLETAAVTLAAEAAVGAAGGSTAASGGTTASTGATAGAGEAAGTAGATGSSAGLFTGGTYGTEYAGGAFGAAGEAGAGAGAGGTVAGGAAAAGGTGMSVDWGSIAKVAGGVISASGAGSSAGAIKRAGAAADPFGPYRAGYAEQLQALMADPSSITSDPGYEFGLSQGEQAIQRHLAQTGELGSGREAIELQGYAQQYAGQYLLAKEQQLAGLGGANIAPNNLQTAQLVAQQQQNAQQQWGQVANLAANVDWSSLANTIGSWF